MKKKTLLITGASRGIGAAIARRAATEFSVVINYQNSVDAANNLVKEIEQAGGSALAIRANVGVQSEVKSMFHTIDDAFGGLDILINNAGKSVLISVATVEEAALLDSFQTNLFSMYYCSKEAINRMSTDNGGNGGVIINMSSVASRLGGMKGGAAYAASKGAIDSLTLAMAKEVGKQGIRVNAIRPGLIETDIHDVHGGIEPMRELASAVVPMGRSGLADEVASVALWLASKDASYVHGALIDVSGGR